MTRVQNICEYLESFAPSRLAEDWDNVGLLVGRRQSPVTALMTCLTLTPASVAEAVEEKADLVVAHHPLPFRSLKRITDDHTSGQLLLDLISAGVAVYSPHTAFDSAAQGINQQLALLLGVSDPRPLRVSPDDPDLGAGRWGELRNPAPVSAIADVLRQTLGVPGLHQVGGDDRLVHRLAAACGSAGEFLESARIAGCELLVTGETSFHTSLEAEARGMALLLPGHYASERFAVEQLADRLAAEYPALRIWASRRESDPLRWV